jgi:hypothetical protein
MLALCVSSLLFLLSIIHVYWALGGKRGMKVVLPEIKIESKPLFMPGSLMTFIVAALLCVAGLIVLGAAQILPTFLPAWIRSFGIWALTIVFLLRSVGDFRYIGFFKLVHDTTFARFDSWLYSPLTLALAIGCLLIALR